MLVAVTKHWQIKYCMTKSNDYPAHTDILVVSIDGKHITHMLKHSEIGIGLICFLLLASLKGNILEFKHLYKYI